MEFYNSIVLPILNSRIFIFFLGVVVTIIADRWRQVSGIHAQTHSRMSDAVLACNENLLLFMQNAGRYINYERFESGFFEAQKKKYGELPNLHFEQYRVDFNQNLLFYPKKLEPIHNRAIKLNTYVSGWSDDEVFTTKSVNTLIETYTNKARNCLGVKMFEENFASTLMERDEGEQP